MNEGDMCDVFPFSLSFSSFSFLSSRTEIKCRACEYVTVSLTRGAGTGGLREIRNGEETMNF